MGKRSSFGPLVPYRSQEIVIESKKLERLGKGYIIKLERVKPHVCNTPGRIKRWFARLVENDVWICGGCGKAYELRDGYSDKWRNLYDERRDEMLKVRGLPNPWLGDKTGAEY
jgi:hypothetical protein